MPTLGYQMQHHRMTMDVQIIHRQKERSTGAILSEPIEQLQQKVVEPKEIGSPFDEAPVKGERLAHPLVARDGHQKAHTPLPLLILTPRIAPLLPNHLPILPILGLQLIIALVEINYIPCALAQNTLRIHSLPVPLALVQIDCKISTVGGR